MKPNPDQLAHIHAGHFQSNPASYDPPAEELKAPQPTIILGPNAVYLVEPGHWDEKVGEANPPIEPPPVEDKVPTLTSLAPAELPIWAQDTEVFFNGTNFTEASVIIWNGGEEVTKFVNSQQLSTLVKPSTVAVSPPFTLETYVTDSGKETAKLPFTFIA